MQEPSDDTFQSDNEVESLKLPPHSIESERAVIGGIFLDAAAWDKIGDTVTEDDFYRRDHRLIFSAIAALNDHGQPCDLVTVAEWLENHQLLDEIGGMKQLAIIVESTPTASNIKAYADIVRKRSILRQLLKTTSDIQESVFNPKGREADEILDHAEQLVFEVAEQKKKSLRKYQGIKDLLVGALDRIEELFQKQSPITGLPTGYNDFDMKTAGLQKSDLIIIAGRPSMGKTAFAINIAEHVALREEAKVAVFSMEMPSEQLVMRMVGSLSRIDQQKIRTGKLQDEDWPRLTSTVGLLQDAELFIDDTPALTPSEIRARTRRIAREHGLDLIIVDYLQLMQVAGTKENRATEISEISRSLKAMAKELNVPVIALSQLNRSLEQRPNKRPVMSDLRESGAIEQDADLILFIYRDEVYNPESADKGTAEIIIAKQRNGPIGMFKLSFLGQFTRFESFVESDF